MAASLAYLLLHALPVFAQQPADPPPAEPQVAEPDPLPPPPPVWSGTGELTILATSGNVSSVTFGATGELARQKGRWRTNARAAFLRGELNPIVLQTAILFPDYYVRLDDPTLPDARKGIERTADCLREIAALAASRESS